MIKPIKAEALSKYKIKVTFEDGVTGEADLSDSAGKGIFKFWDAGNNFDKVYINSKTSGIAWSEELEICPETVYDQITAKIKEPA
jgi:hypothetical protein